MYLQLYGDYHRKSYVVLFALILFLFIYFKLYTRADKEKTKQHSTLSLALKMNHDHDHAAMLENTNPSNPATVGQGLHMMMMAMTFHGGYKETILFETWETKTVGAFVASWLAIFFLAAFYEGLKTFRDVLAQRGLCNACSPTRDRTPTIGRLLSLPHMMQTLLHVIQMTISYFLMLIAMTFNTYLLLAVVFGAGLGHFLFGWRRSSVLDHNEHCH